MGRFTAEKQGQNPQLRHNPSVEVYATADGGNNQGRKLEVLIADVSLVRQLAGTGKRLAPKRLPHVAGHPRIAGHIVSAEQESPYTIEIAELVIEEFCIRRRSQRCMVPKMLNFIVGVRRQKKHTSDSACPFVKQFGSKG